MRNDGSAPVPVLRRPDPYDVVVVGGGPAGLAAALWLARYRRRVRVYDAGSPRNRTAWAVHGYPGVHDLPPAELRSRLRQQATGAGAEYAAGRVAVIAGDRDRFRVVAEDLPPVTARRILLAYGLRDALPAIPGIRAFAGRSVFHCPDCDGPSVSGARVAVLGADAHAAALALFLRTWTDQITLLADGAKPRVDRRTQATLSRCRIAIRPGPIVRLAGHAGRLRSVVFEDGHLLTDALFLHPAREAASNLASDLGCDRMANGDIRTGEGQQTSTAGVYAAGDITGHPHLAVVAAAEGVAAALAIHRSLLPHAFRVA